MGGLKWKPWISAENDDIIYAQPLNTKEVLVVMEVMEQSDSCGLMPSVSSTHLILEIQLFNVRLILAGLRKMSLDFAR